jgi:hypothetical protein
MAERCSDDCDLGWVLESKVKFGDTLSCLSFILFHHSNMDHYKKQKHLD